MAFTLNMFPWVYTAKFNGKGWDEKYFEQEHMTYQEEKNLPEDTRNELMTKRNHINGLPLINYTTQYGLGCFEGLKAFPRKKGGYAIFRPRENAKRMKRSMDGLMMPSMNPDQLTEAILESTRRNINTGFKVEYNPDWEKDNFMNASSIYIRPFAYSEPAIGLNLSSNPWIVIASTPVSAYFKMGKNAAVTTDMIRATRNGTGWIKCSANYVIPALAKNKAIQKGYMECIFLDSVEHKYIEEGSSCNFFALLKDGTLVTPELGDTILPGITRKSVIKLAEDMGITVEERKLSIDEVLKNAEECFVTGTAAGITPITSIDHKDKQIKFKYKQMGTLTSNLVNELKGIQYGNIEDKHNWMVMI